MTKPKRTEPISLDTELIADLTAEETDATQIRGGLSVGIAAGEGAARGTIPKTGGGGGC